VSAITLSLNFGEHPKSNELMEGFVEKTNMIIKQSIEYNVRNQRT
jgi:hypothetical protein